MRLPWLLLGVLAIGCRSTAPAEDAELSRLSFDPTYLDRARIQDEQTVKPPERVTTILRPTLGFPERLEPSKTSFEAILATSPDGLAFRLVPRQAITALDQGNYVLAPPEDFSELTSLRRELDKSFGGKFDWKALAKVPAAMAPFVAKLGTHELAGPLKEWLAAGQALVDARGEVTDQEAFLAWRSELHKLIFRLRQGQFDRQQKKIVSDHADPKHVKLDEAIKRVRDSVAAASGIALEVVRQSEIGGGDLHAYRVTLRGNVPPGLYALVALRGAELVDFQPNAVYAVAKDSSPEDEFRFVVAADFQWGGKPRVAASVLRFVETMNELVLLGDPADKGRPEFAILDGDIVDCSYASAPDDAETLLDGPPGHVNDYLQAWLVLSALKLPVYIVPGNHDGYRFVKSFWNYVPLLNLIFGKDTGDGILDFESTFGPAFFYFDRGPYRFICLDSYDLPDRMRSLRDFDRLKLEAIFRKTNKVNWGGGIRRPQYSWLRRALGLEGDAGEGKRIRDSVFPVLSLHHDPRSAVPGLVPEKHAAGNAPWGSERHFPVTADGSRRGDVNEEFSAEPDRRRGWAPRGAETTEYHEGFYTPFRESGSAIGVEEWFEQWPRPPAGGGYPGWIRYQQVWHANLAYSGDLEDKTSFTALDGEDDCVDPLDLLGTIVKGRPVAMFEAHDNLFRIMPRRKGTGIFSPQTTERLRGWAKYAKDPSAMTKRLDALVMDRDLWIFRTADVGDAESDGHGYFWVRAGKGGSVYAEERDLPLGVMGRFEDSRSAEPPVRDSGE